MSASKMNPLKQKDDRKHNRQAMEACVDIYAEYTKEEVQQISSPSIQFAWFVGKSIAESK